MSSKDKKPTVRRVLTEADIANDPAMVEKIKLAASAQNGPPMSARDFQTWLKNFQAR